MAANRIWIMDGHNMIFALGPLQRLQVSDRREEARAGLTERLERFAMARSERVLVVFDSSVTHASAGARRSPLFEVVYTPRGEGAADQRILREAERCLERGMAVTVVTNDRRTLASRLPRGARHLGVREFWRKQIEPEAGESGKRVLGDFSDVEREMLARAAATEPALDVSESSTTGARAGGGAAEPSDPAAHARAATRRTPGEASAGERLRRKRQAGALRQERRLDRRARSGRRR